jgi:putative Mg2+ transporter-C (MgtC) family protein
MIQMIGPASIHVSELEQMLLSAGTATRLLSACVFGGLVGLEREFRKKASGIRTNMMICLGCAFFTMLSVVIAGENSPNRGQIAANIVQGIGFLGAGLILHTRSRVLGLTSAATVFVVASIGMACGAGLYLPALLATVIVLLAQTLMRVLEMHLDWKQYPLLYEVRGANSANTYTAILAVLDKAGIRLNIVDRDTAAPIERITFLITTNRSRHHRLLTELRDSDATDQVLSFRDPDEE